MKIVQYLGTLGACGAETVIRNYAVELNRRGHEVIVPIYYTCPESPNQKILEAEKIRIDIIRGRYSRNLFLRMYNKGLSYLGYDKMYLKKLLKDEKPDILHLHGYVLNDLKYLTKELEGVSLFYTCHNPPEEFFEGKWKKQYSIAKRLINNYGMKMIAITDEMAEKVNSYFDIDNTIVLNNPIDLSRFMSEKKDKVFMRKKYGIPQNAFVIGHVGRFHPQKNHMFLVDIFNEVYKLKEDAFLLLVASSEIGEQKNVLKKLKEYQLEDRCMILYDQENVEELYAVMDVFCFPSVFEGFGLALLEAQASELKCIVSDQISQSVIVKDRVQKLSLDKVPAEWANALLFGDEYIPAYHSLQEYELGYIIDKLERMYLTRDD